MLVVYHAGTSSKTSEEFIAALELALVTNTITGIGTTATFNTNANTINQWTPCCGPQCQTTE